MAEEIHCEPAASVIEKIGGAALCATITARDVSVVRRWRLKKPAGTDGLIPDDAKIALIDYATKNDIELVWGDFEPPVLKDAS